jgi:DNA-binding XRE family transcriptional regulator
MVKLVRIVRGRIIAELRTIRTMVNQDVLQRFGDRLRQLRKDGDWSQEAFAEASGLDRSYFGSVERGERNVALKNIEAIAETFGLTISELMDGV